MILAAVDFSESTKLVVEEAATLAEALGSRLVVVHVAAPNPDFVGYEAGPPSVRDARAHELRMERSELRSIADSLQARGLSAESMLVQGPTIEKILEEADRLGAQRIVVGTHGRGTFSRALLGSVSQGVVRGATCPVVVVPAPGRARS